MATRSRRVVATVKGLGKDLLTAAKDDLTSNSQGLKQDFMELVDLARSKRRSARAAKITTQMDLTVNPDAGAELLSHYREEWSAMHRHTEKASLEASKMDKTLHDIKESLSRAHTIISASSEEFHTLPEVVAAIDRSKERVEEIGKALKSVEESIVEYNRVTAQLENERKRHSLKIQFGKHREANEEERQRLEKILQQEQRLTTDLEDAIESQKVQDRQKAFQDMFDQQMADYRESGTVERPIGVDEKERSGSFLEDVVIEDQDGTASLNEFLGDVVMEEIGSHAENNGSGDQQSESDDKQSESGDQQSGSGDQQSESGDQEQETGDPQSEEEFHDCT